ncbi:MAG TPA: thioredoxin family protein, partial [Candidatus Saccharimonadia bacterium]|nr:thioredoxin family protein [Candidatus Saccharimonadia bacterium]
GLAESAHDRTAARREGFAYLAGVVASFVALAIALLALRASGAALGWGFQLQSPWVVATLALVMVATGLSLSGVWAPSGAWTGAGQSLAARGGARGAVVTGVLAVGVASPCTAPFMGPALGYAVTQSAAVALLVFATLGVGLAAPLVVLSFAPALARRLPRPGAWMDTLKQVLAFPMYLAALWLFWVLGRQAGVDAMAQALLAALALGFAAWRLGRPATTRTARAVRALAIAAGLVACVVAVASIEPRAPGAASTAQDGTHEPWTGARLATLRADGRPVFVNMTAAWCITCLANERVALSTDAVRDAFAHHDVAYLKGDWTQRDDAITAYLAQFGRNGVPLYVLYPRGGGEPRVLPQMLTPGLVLEALADADARADAQAAVSSPP